MEGKNTMKPGEGTQQTDKGKEKEVNREGSPPLQTYQITRMEQTRERPKTPIEYVADMAQRVLTSETEQSERGNSSDYSDDSNASWRERRRKEKGPEKREASKEPEEGEHETKKPRFGSEEEGNRTPASQERWPEYNPADYVSDTSNRPGSDVSRGEDNPFQDEVEIFNDHVESYERYKKENGEVLDTVLKSEKMNRKTIEYTIRNIRDMDTEDVGTAMAILKATNQQLDRIVNTVEIEISD